MRLYARPEGRVLRSQPRGQLRNGVFGRRNFERSGCVFAFHARTLATAAARLTAHSWCFRIEMREDEIVKMAIEIAGWIAAVLILAAYGLLSAGKLTGKSVSYQVMNIVGAIGFVINTVTTAPSRQRCSTSSGWASVSGAREDPDESRARMNRLRYSRSAAVRGDAVVAAPFRMVPTSCAPPTAPGSRDG